MSAVGRRGDGDTGGRGGGDNISGGKLMMMMIMSGRLLMVMMMVLVVMSGADRCGGGCRFGIEPVVEVLSITVNVWIERIAI